jgi:transposase, IS6 family
MLGLKLFRTAKSVIARIESYAYSKKRQLVLRDQSVHNQVKFIQQLFGMAAF